MKISEKHYVENIVNCYTKVISFIDDKTYKLLKCPDNLHLFTTLSSKTSDLNFYYSDEQIDKINEYQQFGEEYSKASFREIAMGEEGKPTKMAKKPKSEVLSDSRYVENYPTTIIFRANESIKHHEETCKKEGKRTNAFSDSNSPIATAAFIAGALFSEENFNKLREKMKENNDNYDEEELIKNIVHAKNLAIYYKSIENNPNQLDTLLLIAKNLIVVNKKIENMVSPLLLKISSEYGYNANLNSEYSIRYIVFNKLLFEVAKEKFNSLENNPGTIALKKVKTKGSF